MPTANKNQIARSLTPYLSRYITGGPKFIFKIAREIVANVVDKLGSDRQLLDALQHLINNGYSVLIDRNSDNTYRAGCFKEKDVALFVGQNCQTIEEAIQSAVEGLEINGK